MKVRVGEEQEVLPPAGCLQTSVSLSVLPPPRQMSRGCGSHWLAYQSDWPVNKTQVVILVY